MGYDDAASISIYLTLLRSLARSLARLVFRANMIKVGCARIVQVTHIKQ